MPGRSAGRPEYSVMSDLQDPGIAIAGWPPQEWAADTRVAYWRSNACSNTVDFGPVATAGGTPRRLGRPTQTGEAMRWDHMRLLAGDGESANVPLPLPLSGAGATVRTI